MKRFIIVSLWIRDNQFVDFGICTFLQITWWISENYLKIKSESLHGYIPAFKVDL